MSVGNKRLFFEIYKNTLKQNVETLNIKHDKKLIFVLEQAMKTQRGSRDIALLFP
jgi:hypothetical protein